jgi:hypothetical protein
MPVAVTDVRFGSAPSRLSARVELSVRDAAHEPGCAAVLDAGERPEAHGGAREADHLAELREEAVVDEHANRLTHPCNIGQPRRQFVEAEHARMRVRQGLEDSALGEVRIGHRPSVREHVFDHNG